MTNNTTDDIPFGADDLDPPVFPRPPRGVSEITADWDSVLSKLAKAPPKVAEGPFRWPHHGCFTRNRVHVELPLEETWQEIDRILTAQPEMVCPRLIKSCYRHAWEAGKVLSTAGMDILRPQLDPEAQGRLLASASDSELEWVAAHLDGVSLTPETLLEIATQACSRHDAALLARVLQKGVGLMNMTLRRMEPLSDGQWSDESHWADQVSRLSHRVADMLLETALVRAFSEGVELALEHGADPNIKLWRLERSFNAWHTSVHFPLAEWGGLIRDEKVAARAIKHVTDLLIQHPAFAKGGRHFPALMESLQRGRHKLCERLLAAGVTFQSDDKPEWAQKTMESGDVDWSRCYWLWPKDSQGETARQLADAVPLIPASEALWFHSPGAQGGTWMTPLSLLLKDKDLPHLIRYAAAGLPLRPTYQDCLRIIQNKPTECLSWLLGQWEVTADEHPKLLKLIAS
jgi:hypothetical protein